MMTIVLKEDNSCDNMNNGLREKDRQESILKDYYYSPDDRSWMTEPRKWECAVQWDKFQKICITVELI